MNPVFSIRKQYDNDIHYIEFPNINQLDTYKVRSLNLYLGSENFSQYDNFLSNCSTPIEGPYPIALRNISGSRYLIERPPMQIRLDYSPTSSSRFRKPIKPVSIWIPWVVMVVDFQNLNNSRMFFNDKPIQSLDDTLIVPWTSNVFNDGKICWGQSTIPADLENFDLQDWFNNALNEYFFGGWNSDLFPYNFHYFHAIAPEYFPSSYSPQDLKASVENTSFSSQIYDRIKSKNFKFYNSRFYSFKTSNIYYNLSFLDLDQTLDLVKKIRESSQLHYYRYKISDLMKVDNSSSFNFNYFENYFNSGLYSNPIAIQLSVNNNNFLSINKNSNSFSYSEVNDYLTPLLDGTKPLSQHLSDSYVKKNFLYTVYKYFNLKHHFDFLNDNAENILDEAVAAKRAGKSSVKIVRQADLTPTIEEIHEHVLSYFPLDSEQLKDGVAHVN